MSEPKKKGEPERPAGVVTDYLLAGYPILVVEGHEEARMIRAIAEEARGVEERFEVTTWAAGQGLRTVPREGQPSTQDPCDIPSEAVTRLTEAARAAGTNDPPRLLMLQDAHLWHPESDPVFNRAVRAAYNVLKARGWHLVFLSPRFPVPLEWSRMVETVEWPYPSEEELGAKLRQVLTGSEGTTVEGGEDRVLLQARGMTSLEAENAFALLAARGGRITPEGVGERKAAALKRSGVLEYIEPDPRGLDAVGGLAPFKDWLLERQYAFTPEAREEGLDEVNGALLVGVQGSGKSLCAKCIGTAYRLPTFRLDFGAIFGPHVGESEATLRDALRAVEAMGYGVLWLEELDKGMSLHQTTGAGDSGTSARVYSTLLTWWQEKKPSGVFVIATANQPQHLDAALLRRFDEVFAVDLPTQVEREEIARVHLEKRGQDADRFNLAAIGQAAKGYIGSEIERAIVDARFACRAADKRLDSKAVVDALRRRTPLSKTASEQIEAIRKWGKDRARAANAPEEGSGEERGRKVRRPGKGDE